MGGIIPVERATLAAMERGGLTRGDVALLARVARKGDQTAFRALSRAAGSAISDMIPDTLDAQGRPVRSWNPLPVMIATVTLAPGLGWRAGELLDPRGMLPGAVATAAIGRPIGQVLEHRDINPDLIVAAPLRGGSLRVDMETVELPVPLSPLARLRAWRILSNRRSVETRTGSGIKATLVGASLLTTLSVIQRLGDGLRLGAIGLAGTAVMTLSAAGLTLMALDAITGRGLSGALMRRRGKPTSFNMVAASDQNQWQTERDGERGFDDQGRRV